MKCPNCKAVGTLHVYRSGAPGFPVYVGCEAKDCHWSQEPLPELVIEAAVATWHRANPTIVTVADMERVSYSIGLDHNDEWCIWRVGFSGRSVADARTWAKRDRWLAQNALAEFVNAKAAELGEVA